MRLVPWFVVARLAGAALAVGSLVRVGELQAARQDDTARPDAGGARLFEEQIDPLLARHCLECHDSASKQGRLDLSRRESALAGGHEGPSFVPGKAEESPLWDVVESGLMPMNRPPLSDEETRLLRRWIGAGAPWTLDVIGPAALARGGDPADLRVQRLTVPEYIETVRAAVGVDIARDAARLLPRDLRADGFSNTSYSQAVDLEHVEAYALLAERIAANMDVAAFASRFAPCRDSGDECMRS